MVIGPGSFQSYPSDIHQLFPLPFHRRLSYGMRSTSRGKHGLRQMRATRTVAPCQPAGDESCVQTPSGVLPSSRCLPIVPPWFPTSTGKGGGHALFSLWEETELQCWMLRPWRWMPSLPWQDLWVYACPPHQLLNKILTKLRQSNAQLSCVINLCKKSVI